MSIFQNSFFSVKGQLERLSNVKNTLIASVTGKGVKSNTGIKPLDTALSALASNPITTALPIGYLKAPALTNTAIKTAVSSLPLAGKIALGVAVPVTVSAVATNPKVLVSVAESPKNVANLVSNVTNFASNPSISNAKQIIKENPILASAGILATVATVGGGAGLAANTVATYLNSKATKENTLSSTMPTESISEMPSSVNMQPSQLVPNKSLTPAPSEAVTASLVATKAPQTQISRKRRKTKTSRRLQPVGVNQTKVLNIITNKVSKYG